VTDNRIATALLDAHYRGIAMRLATDNDKAFDTGSDVDKLRRSGIQVRVDRSPDHMHHKFAIFDNEILLTGSYNWTRSAALVNLDNFIIVSDPGLIARFAREFERLWREFG
jgi:phosphatidylserine/phosphatidylglycerophosphate/cardiolipin synthase-like enzyme